MILCLIIAFKWITAVFNELESCRKETIIHWCVYLLECDDRNNTSTFYRRNNTDLYKYKIRTKKLIFNIHWSHKYHSRYIVCPATQIISLFTYIKKKCSSYGDIGFSCLFIFVNCIHAMTIRCVYYQEADS